MNKLSSLFGVFTLLCVLCVVNVACQSEQDEIKHATGTVVGSYSNGFVSLLVQVDAAYSIGKTIEDADRYPCATLFEEGTYQNLIQVQGSQNESYEKLNAELINKKISFNYRVYQEKNDKKLFIPGSGIFNGFCMPPDVPIYVITDYETIKTN